MLRTVLGTQYTIYSHDYYPELNIPHLHTAFISLLASVFMFPPVPLMTTRRISPERPMLLGYSSVLKSSIDPYYLLHKTRASSHDFQGFCLPLLCSLYFSSPMAMHLMVPYKTLMLLSLCTGHSPCLGCPPVPLSIW